MASMPNAPDQLPLTVDVGHLTRAQLIQRLSTAGILLNEHARTLLEHQAFDTPQPQTLQVRTCALEALGLPEGAVQSVAFAAARDQGLELCPLVTGPYLRLALRDQANAPDSVLSAGRAPTGSVHVASAPVSEDVDYPKGFYLRVVDDQLWLRGYRCDDDYVWPPEQQLAFVVPDSA